MVVKKIITYEGEIEDTDINLELVSAQESKLVYPSGHEMAGKAVLTDEDTHTFASFPVKYIIAKIKVGEETFEEKEEFDGVMDLTEATTRLTAALAEKLGVTVKEVKEVEPIKLGVKE